MGTVINDFLGDNYENCLHPQPAFADLLSSPEMCRYRPPPFFSLFHVFFCFTFSPSVQPCNVSFLSY